MLSDKTSIPEAPRQSKDKDAPEELLRMDKVHGGKTLEFIETPEPMNNPECEHEWELDPTEEEFIAYRCTKKDCGLVVLYDK